jgi:hypothetical protein
MKVIALCVAGFCAGLVATSACAGNLQLTPAHPAVDQAFTIDVDYVTTCSGPIADVSAKLLPPDPVFDFEHVYIGSPIQCFDRVGTHVVHLSATLPGLAAGTYPIYSAVSILDGYDPPYLDTQLQGNVTVGPAGAGAAAAPTLSTWASILLTFVIGIAAITVRAGRIPLIKRWMHGAK